MSSAKQISDMSEPTKVFGIANGGSKELGIAPTLPMDESKLST